MRNDIPMTQARQRGATLFVTLILLLILALTGVYTMAAARMQLLMTANFQFSDKSFQAAESGIQATMTTPGLFDRSFTLDVNSDLYLRPAASTTSYVDGNGISYHEKADITTSMEYVGTLISGFSNLVPAYYNVDSTGRSGAGAESVHTQGVVYPVPKLDDRSQGNKY